MTRARKGEAYVPQTEILIRDAFPLASEFVNPESRKQAERRRDLARDYLIGVYRDAERRCIVDQLDPRVRDACEEIKQLSGGRLPARKGGRPDDKHLRLLIWLRVHHAIESGVATVKAIEQVANELPRSFSHVRGIWYDKSPEWERCTRATLAMRPHPPTPGSNAKD